MASVSTVAVAGSGTTGSIGGFTGEAWVSPGNITLSDNNYASVDLSNTNTSSETLIATNFGFSLPSNITSIGGIVCTFERKASAADTIRDNHIYLVHNDNIIGDNKAGAAAFWETVEGDVSFGSPTDMWGISSYTGDVKSVIESASFGVMIDAQYYSAYTGTETAYVDKIYITIYYTAPDFIGKIGTTSLTKIYYGSTQVGKVYYGSIRVV